MGLMGLCGGLLTSWDTSKVTLINHEINSNWIWTRYNQKDDLWKVSNYINIYDPYKPSAKAMVWQDLQRLIDKNVNEHYKKQNNRH